MNFKSWLMSCVCAESFYVYFLYTWSSTYTIFCMKGESWGHNTVAYAFLTSSLFTGRVFGRVMYKTRHSFRVGVTKNNLNTAFIILAALFFGVAVITRYMVLIVLYFFIGFTAARIGASQDDINSQESESNRQTYSTISSNDTETEQARRKIVIFMFSSLISSLLYCDTNDASISFPAFYPCFNFSILLIGILLLNVLTDRSMLQRLFSYCPCRFTSIPSSRNIGKYVRSIVLCCVLLCAVVFCIIICHQSITILYLLSTNSASLYSTLFCSALYCSVLHTSFLFSYYISALLVRSLASKQNCTQSCYAVTFITTFISYLTFLM